MIHEDDHDARGDYFEDIYIEGIGNGSELMPIPEKYKSQERTESLTYLQGYIEGLQWKVNDWLTPKYNICKNEDWF